jgi:hypothetical protein
MAEALNGGSAPSDRDGSGTRRVQRASEPIERMGQNPY